MLKDYNCTIEYYPRKANVVADALNQKSIGNLSYICAVKLPLLVELKKLGVELNVTDIRGVLATLRVRPLVIGRIEQAQKFDSEAKKFHGEIKAGKKK